MRGGVATWQKLFHCVLGHKRALEKSRICEIPKQIRMCFEALVNFISLQRRVRVHLDGSHGILEGIKPIPKLLQFARHVIVLPCRIVGPTCTLITPCRS